MSSMIPRGFGVDAGYGCLLPGINLISRAKLPEAAKLDAVLLFE